MYNSILGKIDSFVKENNITLPLVYYKFSDIFPKAFYDCVIKLLIQAYEKYPKNDKLDGFYIKFDKNRNAYFEFLGTDKNTRVVVIQDNIKYTSLPAAKVIKERFFIEYIKNLDKMINDIILKKLPQEFIQRFIKEPESIDSLLDTIAQEIIYYINYLEIEKNKSYEELEKELTKKNAIEKMYFIEAASTQNMPKSLEHKPKINYERKYDEISLDDRNNLLNSYNPDDQFEAVSSNSTSIYYVKVFKVKEKCKLIIEPKEGTKYTKVVHIDTDKLGKEEIRKIAIDSLQLNRDETTKKSNITRHAHITLKEYKNLLDYLLTANKADLYYGAKKRIDDAEKTK